MSRVLGLARVGLPRPPPPPAPSHTRHPTHPTRTLANNSVLFDYFLMSEEFVPLMWHLKFARAGHDGHDGFAQREGVIVELDAQGVPRVFTDSVSKRRRKNDGPRRLGT